jgi:RNA 3'-terminal phosphate cyclase (ATP)
MCGAHVTGCEKGSTSLFFSPGTIRKADIDLDIGSAGSIPLVVQAWLPVALYSGGTITVTGGTEVRKSPTIDYLEHVFLPILRRSGANVNVKILARGYYPRGGGRVQVTVEGRKLSSIRIALSPDKKSGFNPPCGICSCSSNLPAHVTERQARRAGEVLDNGKVTGCFVCLDPRIGTSTGSSCTTWIGARGANALGKRGIPAEIVGERAARDLLEAFRMPGETDLHMSDQLLPYLVLYGGKFTTAGITTHARTMNNLLRLFGYEISCTGTKMVTYCA